MVEISVKLRLLEREPIASEEGTIVQEGKE
jgi:hypothetical protein